MVLDQGTFLKFVNWADYKFPQRTNHSILTHMRRELDELEKNPNDPEEWADVALLLFHGLHERGFDMYDLETAMEFKFIKNKHRKWGTPDEHGVVEHERGED